MPDDLKDATFQWYVGGKAISGATGKTYIVQNSDIGKRLYVRITTPDNQTEYATNNFPAANAVQQHSYTNNNGFCTVCDEYEPAWISSDGTLRIIMNGGQMFWFAAMVNGDHTHAEFTSSDKSAKARVSHMGTIDLENREWTPIENFSGEFIGFSDSWGNYGRIINMKISNPHLQTGFFASTSNATIGNISLEGTISLPSIDYSSSTLKNSVGGLIASMSGGTVSDVVSNVSISNTSGGVYKHVGGIVGEINTTTAGTTVTKGLFEGSINVKNSHDCIGGIVGYSNQNTTISYCANLGTVMAIKGSATDDPYTGGILGYVNNTVTTVKNCYNYGAVSNDNLSYGGAIVGRLRNGGTSNFTDNYYLKGSAPSGFGKGSLSITAPIAKNKSAFTSGEVFYLVNGKTSNTDESKGPTAIWVQNVDNGKTPYDEYPLFHSATIYYRSDGTYSNYEEKVQVNISWGDMSFEYKKGEWDPDTHKYGDSYWSPATDGGNEVTITNNSNVKLNANVTFTPVTEFKNSYGLSGTFDNSAATLDKSGGTMQSLLTLKTTKTVKEFEEQKIGEVKVKITTIN